MSRKGNTPTKLGNQPGSFPGDEERLQQLLGDQYEVIARIGSGGMGSVFKAKHRGLDQIVAVKVVRETGTMDSNAMNRLRNEARALAALEHENIVHVLNLQKLGDDQLALVMEYIAGNDLGTVLAQTGPLEPARCRKLLSQCAAGLAAAHKAGIVHRDLNPGNLMVTTDGAGNELIKILDFGIAKLVESASQKLTKTGTVMGSPAYMSPEQCLSAPVDIRSDIYSLGCVFYEALTGKVPFEGESAFEVLLKHTNERLPVVECTDVNLAHVIAKCTAIDAATRFQTPEEVSSALNDAKFRFSVEANLRPAPARSLRKFWPVAVVLAFVPFVMPFFHTSQKHESSEKVMLGIYWGKFERAVNQHAEPDPETLQGVKKYFNGSSEPQIYKDMADRYFELFEMTGDAEFKHQYLLALQRERELYHAANVPDPYEVPRIALYYIQSGDIPKAEQAVASEIDWATAHGARFGYMVTKCHVDQLSIAVLAKDEKATNRLRKLLQHAYDTNTDAQVVIRDAVDPTRNALTHNASKIDHGFPYSLFEARE